MEPNLEDRTTPEMSVYEKRCCECYFSHANSTMVDSSEYDDCAHDDYVGNETSVYDMKVTGELSELSRRKLMSAKTGGCNETRK